MTVSVFVGTSVDGFIARPNGDLDWLPAGGGEPHGYDEFIAGVDAIVIGRKTFETVLTFGAWPYGDKRVVVLSSRPVDLSAAGGGVVARADHREYGHAELEVEINDDLFAGFAAYQHWWSPAWRSTVAWGYASVDNPAFAPGSVNDDVQSVHLNLFWSPYAQATFALEYLYATRDTFGGDDGELHRLLFSSKFNF